jgi:hypothetical protein
VQTFISHSQEDAAAYSSLCLVLDGANIPRWDPKKLYSGHSLAEQLRLAIEQCEVCVFIATQQSVKSSWCLAEVGAFWGAGKTVIGYIADSGVKSSELPPQLDGNVWVNDAARVVSDIRTLESRRGKWKAQWQFGSKLYQDELVLRNDADGRVWGERTVVEPGKATTYRVTGYHKGGFWWLEYHDESKLGGGTILAKTITDRLLRGIVVSVNCTSSFMRCAGNQWIAAEYEKDYDPQWQVLLGELPPVTKTV